MALEVFLFRSLFRNTDVAIVGQRPVYGSAKWLWLFALLFHWSLLVIVLRHLRFFIEPIAPWVSSLAALDGFFEIGVPTLYLSDVAVLAGLTFLFLRRIAVPQLRYISLVTDYFALLLLAGVVTTGLLMRHFFPADLAPGEEPGPGMGHLRPSRPQGSRAGLLLFICASFLRFWLGFPSAN